MKLEKLANAWAEGLCSSAGRENAYQKAITAYAIQGFLALLYGALALVVAAALAGAFWATLAVAFTAALLKTFAGGPHLSSPTRCAFAGALIYAALGSLAGRMTLSEIKPQILWGLLALDNLLIWLYAPVESPGKPLQPRQSAILGIIARCIAAAIAFACALWPDNPWVTAACVGCTVHCLSLSKTGRALFSWIDEFLTRIKDLPVGLLKGRRCGD